MIEYDLRKQGIERTTTSVVTPVSSSNTPVLLSAKNICRLECLILNNSNKKLYVKLGAGITLTNYTAVLKNGDTLIIDNKYRGDIYGLWDGINGNALITEII